MKEKMTYLFQSRRFGDESIFYVKSLSKKSLLKEPYSADLLIAQLPDDMLEEGSYDAVKLVKVLAGKALKEEKKENFKIIEDPDAYISELITIGDPQLDMIA